MKPCTYEQDLLFAIHGEATAWQKIRVFVHCLQCPSCRNRKREFVATSHLLMGLRSMPALIPTTHAVPIRKRRLILCSAAVAVAAAAVSYYVAFGWLTLLRIFRAVVFLTWRFAFGELASLLAQRNSMS